MKILLVEDHEDVAEITLSRLERLHEVEWAATGAQALESARSSPPDLLLIDIGLPDMSGHDLVRALRADPRFVDATMIALSGYNDSDERRAALEAGFDAYYTKPMNFSLLEEERARTARRQG